MGRNWIIYERSRLTNRFLEIKRCEDPNEQRRRMWEDWYKFYPKVSWIVLYQSLLYVRQHAVATKIVSNNFLRGKLLHCSHFVYDVCLDSIYCEFKLITKTSFYYL